MATAVIGLAASALPAISRERVTNATGRIRAVAFDAFPVFDPRPVFGLVNTLFADQGPELANVWRTKQFEYCWLRAAAGQHSDFWRVTEDALLFAARKVGVSLSAENRDHLMGQYLALDVWPDVVPALRALREAGIRLTFLSNMTEKMLRACMRHAGIDAYFEHVISTDAARSYKPAPAAYQLGIDTLQLAKEEILFAAFAGWDASGAKWFGYPTFWVNRMSAPIEELAAAPDGTGRTLAELVAFVGQRV